MATDLVATNIAPIWQTATPYVSAGAAVVVGWASKQLNAWLVQHGWSAAQDALDQALEHVPGLVTSELAIIAAHNETVMLPQVISKVAALVAAMAPASVATLKLDQPRMEAIVSGRAHDALVLPKVAPPTSVPTNSTK
jgi:hypothetical protein